MLLISTRRAAFRAQALLPFACLALAAPAQAQQAARVYSASDLPQLAHGVRLAEPGEYTIRVWAPARQEWTLQADGQKLTLAMKPKGNDQQPRWQTAGQAKLTAEEPVKLVIEGYKPPGQAESNEVTRDASKGSSKSARKAAAKAHEDAAKETWPAVVPALVSFSTDSAFDPTPALDVIRARVDTIVPLEDPRRTTVRTNQQGADFKAPASVQAWRDRREAVRKQMLVALGLWPLWPKTELHPQVFGKVERDGYTIEKVVLETLPGFTLCGNLYRPVGKAGRVPVVLCPHGHWEVGRVQPDVQMRCIRWAKLGCAVFLYDMVGYNDSKPFGHAFLNDRLERWGLSLASLQTWNSIRALDWLCTLPDVDVARVGCTGESGGGTQTFLLTALDDRIKVAAPVVMVSDTFQGGCVCENAAGLRWGTDNVEFAALAAPRPMKLVGASGDWTARTMFRAYPNLREVYALYGTPERLSADVFNFPHNYNQTTRNAVYAFMARWLLNNDNAASTLEGDQTEEKPEDLRCFNDDHPAPEGQKTPEQLETALMAMLGRQIDKLAPLSTAATWQASHELLRTGLEVRLGIENPAPEEVGSQSLRAIKHEGLSIAHYAVGRRATSEQVAVVRLTPANATGRLTVVLTPHGKRDLVAPGGQPAGWVKALLERGQSVVGFDPLFVGESADANAYATHRPDTAHYDTYNHSLAADRLQDLATVLAWARAQPDALEVNLLGHGQAGALALLARPLLPGLARTAIDLHDFDYGDGSGEIPAGLDLPGVLQFGALKVSAALASPAPLWIHRASKLDTAWPVKSYALDDASSQLRVEAGRAEAADLARWLDTGDWPQTP